MSANPQLIIDLSNNTGAIKHGACGFLYGMGDDGIPSENTLAPLKPQVVAQKPEGGLQHPNGDALNSSDTFRKAGGKEIEIYIQDIYPNWPYDFLGLEDYLDKVEQVVRQAAAHPNHNLFSYVPFNEPDQIWYNKSDKKQDLFDDWKVVVQKIKSIDPAARIVGPNFAVYDSQFYHDFLAFTQIQNCLPDVISWHELGDDFFTGWYLRYEDYRRIERELKIPSKDICINEYGRISGDVGIPGNLVQWIARFENCKVDACIAYWTSAGCLNDLVTRDNYNKVTGAWWLYKWYGDLTGHTVKVTPPQAHAEGLQALASLDREKRQARILFGGTSGQMDLLIKGFDVFPDFTDEVHLTLWGVDATGFAAADPPAIEMEGIYAIIDGQVRLTVQDMLETAAYLAILTPETGQTSARRTGCYQAEYAEILGRAQINYGEKSGTQKAVYVEGFSPDSGALFVVNVPDNGFYKVSVRYSAAPLENTLSNRSIHLQLNGSPLTDLPVLVTDDWNTWKEISLNIFLTAGINRIAVLGLSTRWRAGIHLDSIEIAPGTGEADTYEAESPVNTLTGAAKVHNDPSASGGQYVSGIGDGTENALQFNHVHAPTEGLYRMVVYYSNAESRGTHSYNNQIAERCANISINGGKPQRVYFRNTFAWTNYQTCVVDIYLKAGKNTICFTNPDNSAPFMDKIQIAFPINR